MMNYEYLKNMNMKNEFNYQKPTKVDYIDAYVDWFKSMNDTTIPFTTTVVYKSSGHKPNADKWIDEYKHKFLWKINKQLNPHSSKLTFFYDFCKYEFGESSRYKSIHDQRNPHHVHGIILIPKDKVNKIWDANRNTETNRLTKDFKSILNISSILIEPIRNDKIQDWISYMMKGKTFNND